MDNHVRTRREQLGLSQTELARRIGVSRQSLHSVETSRAVPSVRIALTLAEQLATHVEALFGGVSPARGTVDALIAHALPRRNTRVLVGELRGRYVAHPIDSSHERGHGRAADGFARQHGKAARVELATPLEHVRDTVFLAGCAPALSVLCERLNDTRGPGRFRWLHRANRAALQAFQRSHVHVAGAHFALDRAPTLSRYLPCESGTLVTFADWEAGLVRGRNVRTRGDAALRDPRVRIALREPGAGAREELVRRMNALGVDSAQLAARSTLVRSHAEVAQAVALGVADVGFCIAASALAHGLPFEPWLRERFDLLLADDLRDGRTARMLDTLSSEPFRREIAALGYDTQRTGQSAGRVVVG